MTFRPRHLLPLIFAIFAPVPGPSYNFGREKQRAEALIPSLGHASAVRDGDTIHVSGVVARGATMDEQVAGVYAELRRTLARFGATLDDVVKETAFTVDVDALRGTNGVRNDAYGLESPAATRVQTARLFEESALVEIAVVARVPRTTS
ncbi:MAG: RidA family protein [Gemmatimonadaceae bacterium]